MSNVQVAIGTETLGDFTFTVPTGSYAVLMGQTGSGKTSILETISGLRPLRGGTVRVGGTDVSCYSPSARNIGYVPQDLVLFPHLNVREHLAFALKLRGESSTAIKSRVDEVADWLEITTVMDRPVTHLSGGEAQRVALGRALSFRPSVLLLDEPLSALDERTRTSAQALLATINTCNDVTVLHVTHNSQEAVALADIRLNLVKGSSTGKMLVQEEPIRRSR